MTSAELKHQARLRDWAGAIRECRSSGQSVRQWCREKGITTTTYYRWERELTAQQYRWLMEGLQIDQPKAHKTVKGLSMI